MKDVKVKPTDIKPKILDKALIAPKMMSKVLQEKLVEQANVKRGEKAENEAVEELGNKANKAAFKSKKMTENAMRPLKEKRQLEKEISQNPINEAALRIKSKENMVKNARGRYKASKMVQRAELIHHMRNEGETHNEVMANSPEKVKAVAKYATGRAFFRLGYAKTDIAKLSQFAKRIQEQIRKRAVHKANKKALEATYKGSVKTVRTTYQTTKFAITKAIQASVAVVKGIIALASGCGILISILVLIAMVATIVASPFGIFYSGQDKNNIPLSVIVGNLNTDFSNQLDQIQEDVPHDSVTIDGETADMIDVLAVYAVKTAQNMDVVTIDETRIAEIKQTFWDFNQIAYDTETIEQTDDDGNSQTQTILHIHITHKTLDDMRYFYAFNIQQNEQLDELLNYRDMFASLLGNLDELTQTAEEWLTKLPPDLDPKRASVIKASVQLVGKVPYFWGGKTNAVGWNSNWGEIQLVTADGSKSTGKYIPYGLDCSGFVTWAFINAEGNTSITSSIGEGTKTQWANCTQISWNETQIGDLVFYPDLSHVGIVCGIDADGDFAIVHENGTDNNVAISGLRGFTLVGRPKAYDSM